MTDDSCTAICTITPAKYMCTCLYQTDSVLVSTCTKLSSKYMCNCSYQTDSVMGSTSSKLSTCVPAHIRQTLYWEVHVLLFFRMINQLMDKHLKNTPAKCLKFHIFRPIRSKNYLHLQDVIYFKVV